MSISESDIMDIIKDHMEAQPYTITCDECGKDLSYESSLDNDLDLKIVVYVCDCQASET